MALPKYHIETIFTPEQTNPDDAHSLLMRLVPPHSRVLELGCASGYLSGYMEQRLGCTVTGLEFDPAAVQIAATRMSHAYVADLDQPDALDLAAPTAPFDGLLAAAILEHLKYPEALLQRAKTLLKPGAWVIVSLPNIAHWNVRLKLLRGRFDYADYGIMDRTHVHFYTVDTGRRLLEDQGYRVEAVHIAGSALQNLANRFARATQRSLPAPLLPGLLAYELIYVATLPG